jgi:molybdopterin molybdotransferase
MLSVEQAQQRILETIQPLPGERVRLADALGRVLVEPAISTRPQPPADNSAMDGYAVRHADLAATAAGGDPTELVVAEEVRAGGWSERELQPGEAVRIFTGAPVPPGADTVVMQEWTESLDDGARVRIDRCGAPGHHVRTAGEELEPGEVFVASGRRLRPSDLALLASQGLAHVTCHRRPVVAIVSTGDEVHEPGQPLPPGHIWAGNAYGLTGYLHQVGAVPRNMGIARDTRESLLAVFARTAGSDAMLTIGGVSVGDYDLVRPVLGELGSVQDFWKVAMRPGKPNAFGRLHDVPYFGLPGNPVSCLVSFLQYVRPALLKMQGCDELFLPTVEAELEQELTGKSGFLMFSRGVVRFDPDSGRFKVALTGAQGSGMVRSLAQANCLVVLPEQESRRGVGERVRVQLLPGADLGRLDPGLRRDAS